MTEWRIVLEEEVPDSWGYNCMGIITNGEDFLFFHILKKEDTDEIETCEVYDSLVSFTHPHIEPILSFEWTPENDSILLTALNDGVAVANIVMPKN